MRRVCAGLDACQEVAVKAFAELVDHLLAGRFRNGDGQLSVLDCGGVFAASQPRQPGCVKDKAFPLGGGTGPDAGDELGIVESEWPQYQFTNLSEGYRLVRYPIIILLCVKKSQINYKNCEISYTLQYYCAATVTITVPYSSLY